MSRGILTRRVLELAEAGQRIRYGDDLAATLLDLLLDWAPDETTRNKILADNPAKLYGF